MKISKNMSILNKVRTSNVLKNSGWIICGKIVQMMIAFIVGVITTRYLGPSNYGMINTAHAYTSLFLPICLLGFSGVFAKVVRDHPGEDGKYLGSGLAVRAAGSLIAILLISCIVWILNPEDGTFRIVCFIYSFTLVFQVFDLFDYWYQSRYESKYASVISVIGYALSSFYKVILLITGKSVVWFAFANVLDYAVIAFIYMTYTVKKNHIRLSISRKAVSSMLGISKHLILSNLMIVLYGQMDKIMLEKMLSASAVGLYSCAFSICTMWTFVLSAIINSMRPDIMDLYHTDKDAYQKRIIQLYSLVFWLSVGISAICYFGAEKILIILYGEEYRDAVGCLRIITWYAGFSYLGIARNIWTVCEGKQRYEKYFASAGFLTNFILNILLIPSYGIEGAAIASLLTQIVTNIITPWIIGETRVNTVLILYSLNPVHLLRMIGFKK